MRTRNYSDLLELIQALCGVVFASIELGRINALVNRRISRAYRASDYWARFLTVGEERAVSDGTIGYSQEAAMESDASLTISSIFGGSVNLQSKLTGAAGNNITVRFVGTADPSPVGPYPSASVSSIVVSGTDIVVNYGPTQTDLLPLVVKSAIESNSLANSLISVIVVSNNTTFWPSSITPLSGGVDGISGGSDIDTFLRIHKDRPYSNVAVQEYDFSVGPDGAKLVSGTLNPSVAYVTYKAALQDSYGQDSTEIPAEWFQYLAHGTYADYLRAEGQQEKAALADQEANEILTDELMRAENVSTQNLVATRFLTNANMQMRYT